MEMTLTWESMGCRCWRNALALPPYGIVVGIVTEDCLRWRLRGLQLGGFFGL